MKRSISTVLATLAFGATALASAGAVAGSAAAAPAGAATSQAEAPTGERAGNRRDFERFLERYADANSAFLNGDPGPWLEMATQRDPASIFGGFGGLGSAGVADVTQRYQLAATAFQPSGAQVDIAYLVKDVEGRLGYTVAIETADVLYTGQTELHHQVLRVTMMFRFEDGEWKIIHRHADTMVELELPS